MLTNYNKDILKEKPFALKQSEKMSLFLPAIQQAARWHYKNSSEFKRLSDNRRFNIQGQFDLVDLPYFPTTIFKKFDLLSVNKKEIIKTIYSSSTSGSPSKIMLDVLTIKNQVKALNNIMASFLGVERRSFIVFDSEETIQSHEGGLSSRGTAIRGLLFMAKKVYFVLDKDLNLDVKKLKKAVEEIKGEKVLYFGFTWLLYNIYLKNKDIRLVKEIMDKAVFSDGLILHIGGWKKLDKIAITKDDFNKCLSSFLGISKNKIIDFYGITEQLGTVYPDCEYGHKHTSLYSEILIRDPNTLKLVNNGEKGFIQLISPLIQSYPGTSVLTDDIGRIIGVDDCPCGRFGTYFVFEERSETAEIKGCGDALKI